MLRRLARWLFLSADSFEQRFASENPLCSSPLTSRETYEALFHEARQVAYPEIDAFETSLGMAIDRQFIDELALHTQVVVKRSPLSWAHGRVLYAVLRDYLRGTAGAPVTIVETGTARGFSSVCMAKALADAGRPGMILTFDVLPHDRPIYWNIIDDLDGPRTRHDLLAPWHDLLADHVVFVQGDSRIMLPRVMPEHVGFAFLDGQHDYAAVMAEFEHVVCRQQKGDVVIFDDVTPGKFPGIVKAVQEIGTSRGYALSEVTAHTSRHYAIARRT